MAKKKKLVITVPLWHIRFMLPDGKGARPLWYLEAPAIPEVNDAITLVRNLDDPERDVADGLNPRMYQVTSRHFVLAAGHPPDLSYSVDVYLAPSRIGT